jgi:hypothetical protein
MIRNNQGMLSNRLITPFVAARASKNVPTNLSRVAIEPQLIVAGERPLQGSYISVTGARFWPF